MLSVVCENAYIYSMWSGELEVYNGKVETKRPDKPNMGVFVGEGKIFTCSNDPSQVYNAVVWLPERDDELAKSYLIDYEECQIAILSRKIRHHQDKIKRIKRGL